MHVRYTTCIQLCTCHAALCTKICLHGIICRLHANGDWSGSCYCDAHARCTCHICLCTHAMHASPPPRSLLRCTSSARNICIIAMPWCVHGTCLCNMATVISNNDAYGTCVIRLADRHHYNVLHLPPNTAKGLACH